MNQTKINAFQHLYSSNLFLLQLCQKNTRSYADLTFQLYYIQHLARFKRKLHKRDPESKKKLIAQSDTWTLRMQSCQDSTSAPAMYIHSEDRVLSVGKALEFSSGNGLTIYSQLLNVFISSVEKLFNLRKVRNCKWGA